MHAASVHPEPGSNSRNHFIKTSSFEDDLTTLSSLALSFFVYFCLSSILFELSSLAHSCSFSELYFVLLSCCSIFKDHLTALLRGDFAIISLPRGFVKYFFKSFLNFFHLFSYSRSRVESFVILALFLFLVKGFYETFLILSFL